MIPTEKSINESQKNVNKIKLLLNDLKNGHNNDNVFQIIQTVFNARGLELNDEYIDLLCSLFGDKLVEANNRTNAEYQIGNLNNYVDGFDFYFGSQWNENGRLEIGNLDERSEISFSRCKETGRWVLDWKEVRFIVEKGKNPRLETTNYNNDTHENDISTIEMNKSIQEITSDVLNIVGNDFLPNGPIRDTLKSGYSKNKRK